MKNTNWSKQDSLEQREKMEKSPLSVKIFIFGAVFVGGFLAYGAELSTGISVISKIFGG